jgi:hypothetical protein
VSNSSWANEGYLVALASSDLNIDDPDYDKIKSQIN